MKSASSFLGLLWSSAGRRNYWVRKPTLYLTGFSTYPLHFSLNQYVCRLGIYHLLNFQCGRGAVHEISQDVWDFGGWKSLDTPASEEPGNILHAEKQVKLMAYVRMSLIHR